jgi:hypothetical protein
MPNVADLLQYRHIRNTAFPFVTAPAPTDTTPKYVAGSNIMTSYKGYTELRPGFDVGLESTPTTFADQVLRTYTWRRWGGTFYIMLCTVGAVAKVWKLAVGIDSSFSLIWTSVSAEPFDFVVSNNFCFFGNGTDMRKFDGTTVTKWGIAAPSLNSVGPNGCSSGTTTGSPAWLNPSRITANDGSDATVSVTGPTAIKNNQVQVVSSGNLLGETFSFAVPATATILGIQLDIKGSCGDLAITHTPSTVAFVAQLLKAGTAVGSTRQANLVLNAVDAFVTVGGSTDLWGSTWTPADINGATFGAQIIGQSSWVRALTAGQTGDTTNYQVDYVRITITYIDSSGGAPTTSVSGTGITATTGWQYVYCYMNSITGHVSSPSPASVSTGPVANKTVNVTVTASTDPQVDKIRIFRTTDGGGGIFFEISGGPFANASTSYPDTTTDANLSIITAPTFGFNDPPPNMKGMVWFANRIWGFNNASLFFTDWEEMNIGVPEEGSVSGNAGNFFNFSDELTGLSVAQDGVIVFCAGHIFKIDGDSLDTFRRTVIANGLGCRNRATITRLGGLTAFLGNTNSVWTTDSNSLTEISQYIQPTIDNIDHSQASMTFHLQGQYRWLLLGDQGHSQTIAYDVNNQQWMPPWSIVGQGLSSGETSPGNWTLLMGQQSSKKMLQMIPNQYTDNGSTYAMSGTLNLIPLVNEHLSSGSPIIDLFYPQAPEHVAQLEYAAFEFNAVLPTTVNRMFDDDPATAIYVDLTPNVKDSPLKTVLQGTNILDKWYYDRAWAGKRVSIQFNYAAAAVNPKIYTMTLAYRQVR